MANDFNSVAITFNAGDSRVRAVEFVFKESFSNTPYVIQSFNKVNENWDDNSSQTINFSNSKVFRALPESQLFRLFDNVPRTAKCAKLISNRLILGNYVEGYDLIDSNFTPINVRLGINFTNTPISNQNGVPSLKSNREYEVGIVYLDNYLRQTTVLTSEDNTVYIPNTNSQTQNKLQVRLNFAPPAFAEYYRFYVKQVKVNYDTLAPVRFFLDTEGINGTWILLEPSDRSKINVGDYILVKSDTSGVLTIPARVKVIEIINQPRNFLLPEDDRNQDEEEQPSGVYYRLQTGRYNLDEEAIRQFEFRNRDSTNPTGFNMQAPVQPPSTTKFVG